MWPPLLILWTNFHAGFVFGLGTIGLHVLGRTLESWREARFETRAPARGTGARERLAALARATPWLEWGCLAAALAATLVNPFGIRIFEYPLAYLDAASPFRRIVEWQPPGFGLDPLRFDGRFWWLAALSAPAALSAVRRAPYLVALAAVTFAMAVTSRRFIPLFGFVSAPLLAMGLSRGVGALAERWPALRDRRLAWAMTALAIALAGLSWRDVRVYPNLLDRWTQSHFYPQAAVRYLRAMDPPKRLLNLYNWGGYLMLHAPGTPVFIDGRANTIYGERVYNDYLRLQTTAPGYRTLLARYGVDMVLFPRGSAPAVKLEEEPGAWQPLYIDRVSVILVPPDSPYLRRRLPNPDVVVGDHPDRLAVFARKAALAGRFEAAERLLERGLRSDPIHTPSYGELAAVRFLEGNLEGIDEAIERGIRALPRDGRRLRQSAARLYESAGDLDRAIEELRGGVPTGPFMSPTGARRHLENLERRRSEARRRDGEGD
jgi:tetratricopeptide (TPR) repeat protein